MAVTEGAWPRDVNSPFYTSSLQRPVKSAASVSSYATYVTDGFSSYRPRSSARDYDNDSGRPQSVSSASTFLPSTPQRSRPVTTLDFARSCRRVIELETAPCRKDTLHRSASVPVTNPGPPSPSYSNRSYRCTSSASSAFLSRNRSAMFDRLRKIETAKEEQARLEAKKPDNTEAIRDSFIVRLRQEIDNLVLAIEEEKLLHKETRQKLAQVLAAKTGELRSRQESETKQVTDEHSVKMNDLRTTYKAEIGECSRVGTETEEKFQQRLITLRSAFETYRVELRQRLGEEFKGQLGALQSQHDGKVQQASNELRSLMEAEKKVALLDMERKHRDEMNRSRKEYEWDLEDAKSRFSENSTDLEQLQYTERRVQEMEKELSQTEDRFLLAINRLEETKQETATLETQIKTYEETFEDRVQAVHQKHSEEIEELTKQIQLIEASYLSKCETAFERQQLADAILAQRVRDAKAAMQKRIQEREKRELEAQQLVAALEPSPPPNTDIRPSSSPTKRAGSSRLHATGAGGRFIKPVEITWEQMVC